jgi:hypothetical protein
MDINEFFDALLGPIEIDETEVERIHDAVFITPIPDDPSSGVRLSPTVTRSMIRMALSSRIWSEKLGVPARGWESFQELVHSAATGRIRNEHEREHLASIMTRIKKTVFGAS